MDQLLALERGGLLGQDDELVPAEARDGVHRVNDALCTMLGYSREDLLQRSFHDSVDPDDRPRASRSLRAAMIGSFTSDRVERRYVTTAGGWAGRRSAPRSFGLPMAPLCAWSPRFSTSPNASTMSVGLPAMRCTTR
jgi:PAS domain-containing protein